MRAVAALPRLRARAETLMTDACTITRGETRATDPATGVVTVTPGATLYSGKCRVDLPETTPDGADVGETRTYTLDPVVKIPIDATAYAKGDLVEVTASKYHPSLVGARYRVHADAGKSHATVRRLRCQEGP